MDNGLFEKFGKAGSVEELMTLAENEGVKLERAEGEKYFNALRKSGELGDDELDSVSGGACYTDDGYLKTTCGYGCSNYEESPNPTGVKGTCFRCKYWHPECVSTFYLMGAPATCTNPLNRKKK